MPVLWEDFQWHQSLTELHLDIRCPRGLSAKDVNVLQARNYLKISRPPFLLELFLPGSTNVEQTKCLLQDGWLLVQLSKSAEDTWPDLRSFNASLSKEAKASWRGEALQWRLQYEADRRRAQLTAERNRERHGTAQSIEEEQRSQKRIQQAKEQIRRNFESGAPAARSKGRVSPDQQVCTSSLADKLQSEGGKWASMPPPRTFGSVCVTMTARHFTTPVRESSEQQEQQWLQARQAAVNRVIDAHLTDVPSVLARAQSFFRLGDVESAVHVYSFGLEHIAPDCAALYSNRAACHLKMKHYQSALQDASKALSLLQPEVAANAAARARALARRAAALAELGCHQEAALELEAARRLAHPD